MSPSVRGRKPIVHVPSSEQIQNLYKQSEIQRRQLVCTGCQTMDSLCHNGASPGDLPQPSFICECCNKNYNAPTMVNLLQPTSTITELPPDANAQNSLKISGSSSPSPENNGLASSVTIAYLQSTIEKLYAELKQIQAKLKQALSAIQALRKQQASADSKPYTDLNNPQFLPLCPSSQPLPPWRDAAQLNSIKASILEKCQRHRIQRQETTVRFLQPPSKN
ncbi:uncharacterized protein RHIMIDRAFT_309991 [Rhizopus microsporus ATCC 52813]|uniref:Uncharacterized protein n=1 Tax=Rhizopus microsporus ATCC 52813 TaxID=1340429 RepID=A0A2G4T932_RHIZD|nr:uncharacterized protein RHIMIDRAFT_309991 [Rhizopus microsporus ATCC 52813]PHZ17196.1 hypothetical protein RHIMIDRAFT_309991 [Rhizopus microsporus ATCC 52813]